MVPVQLPGAARRRHRPADPVQLRRTGSAPCSQYVFAPIGFNWQISIALVPGLAAREVAVGALGTVYAMSAGGDDVAGQLEPVIASTWSLATACSLLAWYVFAPQCLSTLAVVKRETNSWRYPAHHGGLPVRAGLPGLVHHLSRRRGLGVRLRAMAQQILVAAIVVIALAVSIVETRCPRAGACARCWRWTAGRRAIRGSPRWRERSLKPRIARAAGTGCAGCAANVGTRPHRPPR